MYELLYLSVSPEGFSVSELNDLLALARRNNHKLGVTGMLVYCNREFMQLLEGDKTVVKKLFEKISLDPRHRNIDVFYQGDIKNRAFTDWSMAFKTMDESDLGALIMGREDFDPDKSPMNVIKDNPNRGKKTFLSLRNSL